MLQVLAWPSRHARLRPQVQNRLLRLQARGLRLDQHARHGLHCREAPRKWKRAAGLRAICRRRFGRSAPSSQTVRRISAGRRIVAYRPGYRSEEHTSELQSLTNLVCRLLLEKKNKKLNHDYDLTRSLTLPRSRHAY